MYQGYRTVWQALGTLTVDNIIKGETEGFFTDEDNDQYLTPYLTVESKVAHEVNKPRRDEPAACTVANISLTTG